MSKPTHIRDILADSLAMIVSERGHRKHYVYDVTRIGRSPEFELLDAEHKVPVARGSKEHVQGYIEKKNLNNIVFVNLKPW